MIKSVKKNFLIVLCVFVILPGGFLFWLSHHYVVPILMYHNVNPTPVHNANTVSPENFEKQMAYLKTHGYKAITLNELVEGIRQGRALDHRSVVVTFDDGYEDNYKYAFPILKKYNIPATIFMISDFIDHPGYLILSEIKEMDKSVINFGSHTRHHIYLPTKSEDIQRDEIINSKKILEQKLGHPIDYFAYPTGGFSEEIKSIVKEAGYQGACTTNRGRHKFNDDVYELKRVKFVNKSSQWPTIWIQLSGYYNFFRGLKDSHSQTSARDEFE